ncbi:hypothetical protein [Pseudanabaena sp. PCC 6802]|uniref:hypothetical protein n=1 Tax=Pseudanabaena sp. PCC 6802 TaxID=118173 RepID=UPI000345763B|nr:hypothetical protein [Pseudanabaena sp. PCC 6802]
MATINIQDLKVTGSNLFSDEESFLNELTSEELDITTGRFSPVVYTLAVGSAFVLSYNIGKISAEIYNKFW